jgi:hypothetical protein
VIVNLAAKIGFVAGIFIEASDMPWYLRIISNLNYFIPFEIYFYCVFVIYKRISQAHEALKNEMKREISGDRSHYFHDFLLDSLENLKSSIELLNEALGGQLTVAMFYNITRLIGLMFVVAFRLSGHPLDEDYSLSFYFVLIIFEHNFIILPCLLGYLIEQKVSFLIPKFFLKFLNSKFYFFKSLHQ